MRHCRRLADELGDSRRLYYAFREVHWQASQQLSPFLRTTRWLSADARKKEATERTVKSSIFLKPVRKSVTTVLSCLLGERRKAFPLKMSGAINESGYRRLPPPRLLPRHASYRYNIQHRNRDPPFRRHPSRHCVCCPLRQIHPNR